MKNITLFIVFLLNFVFNGNGQLKLEIATTLPYVVRDIASIYDGQDSIYIIGGYVGDGIRHDEILKYSIAEDSIGVVGYMPLGICCGRAVIDNNGLVYYFGGWSADGISALLYIFNLYNLSLIRTERFPNPIHIPTADWDGNHDIFITGGYDGTIYSNEIFKYNIENYTVINVGNMTAGRYAASSSWFNQKLYIFGGGSEQGMLLAIGLDDIIQYDPITSVVTTLPIRLPNPIYDSCAISNGKFIYLIGGNPYTNDFVIQFDPNSNEIQSIPVENFIHLDSHACVYIKNLNRIYVIGGQTDGINHNQIWYIDLPAEQSPTTTEPSSSTKTFDIFRIQIVVLTMCLIIFLVS